VDGYARVVLIVSPGVNMVHWICVGVPLQQLGVCLSGIGWVTMATGVKRVPWISVGLVLECCLSNGGVLEQH
jgi:hypothetical protein